MTRLSMRMLGSGPLPLLWLLLLLLLLGSASAEPVSRKCDSTADSCEFWLRVDHVLSMMNGSDALTAKDGKIYRYDDPATPLPLEGLVTGDAWREPRLLVLADGSFPGPSLEVWEDQQLIVHVANDMHEDGVTIHWHGLHQQGTPWMDGVAFVSQCPILPGQTFTYRFKASPSGTFIYHSHIGDQRGDGLYGALIIRKRSPPTPSPISREFVLLLQDYNHDWDTDMMYAKMLYGDFRDNKRLNPTQSLDGSRFTYFRHDAGLINGRGRYYDPNTGTHNGGPLEVFEVTRGQKYRFRVINAGSLFPFRLSVDGHNVTVVATDSYDVVPVPAESFIINPGERFDVEITASQPVGNYWIRGQTLEVGVNHVAEAILRYQGAPERDPTCGRRACTSASPCVVVNCPFTFFPAAQYTQCTRLDELRALADDDPAPDGGPEEIDEFFLNFAFPGVPGNTPSSVNGRSFRVPSSTAQTQPQQFDPDECQQAGCGEEKACRCAQSLTLQQDRIIQMVFLNMGRGKGWAHPVHVHGHSFHVVKMGYGRYDSSTGRFIESNTDINCRGNPDRSQSYCNSATWSNSSWRGGRLPGMELERAIRKDTIIVPPGGYTVVRFRADNPGVWFAHCHIDLHATNGMALMLNESFPQHPPPPPGFFDCQSSVPDFPCGLWVAVGCLIPLCVTELGIIITGYVWYKRKSRRHYQEIQFQSIF